MQGEFEAGLGRIQANVQTTSLTPFSIKFEGGAGGAGRRFLGNLLEVRKVHVVEGLTDSAYGIQSWSGR